MMKGCPESAWFRHIPGSRVWLDDQHRTLLTVWKVVGVNVRHLSFS